MPTGRAPDQHAGTGPSGPAGTATVTVITATGVGATTATATCPTGQHAVGGGGNIIGGNANTTLIGTYPSDALGNPVATNTVNPTSWTANAKNNAGNITAFILCVPN